ncbi:MAG: hypothetical protein LC637_00490 [Xanthomonadaceae bacterium]|nr:hypothetical protein [Xanthomonadaceae bacterium]
MKLVVFFCLLLVLTTSNAYGYLDPGSGSAILQGIIGALAAIGIVLKLYWHRLLRFFGLRKPTAYDDSDEDESTGRPDSRNP